MHSKNRGANQGFEAKCPYRKEQAKGFEDAGEDRMQEEAEDKTG